MIDDHYFTHRNVALVSVYRSGRDDALNVKADVELHNLTHQLGRFLIKADRDNDEEHSTESGYMLLGKQGPDDGNLFGFRKAVFQLGGKMILKPHDTEECSLLTSDGSEHTLGQFTAIRVPDLFRMMRPNVGLVRVCRIKTFLNRSGELVMQG